MMTDAKKVYEIANSIKEGQLRIVRYDFEYDGYEFEVYLRQHLTSRGRYFRGYDVNIVYIRHDETLVGVVERIPFSLDTGYIDDDVGLEEEDARMILAKVLAEKDNWKRSYS